MVVKMERLVCLVVLISLCNSNHGLEKLPEGTVTGNRSLTAKVENGTTMEDGASKVNSSRFRSRPALLMLSVEIIKNGNRSNSTGKARDGSEIFVVDGNTPEEISFFEPPKASPYFPRFSEISMRTLYLIVCMCLLILLLMIVKLLVSRRERRKDYDMVTKGEFDA